jgi:hypothetical protein
MENDYNRQSFLWKLRKAHKDLSTNFRKHSTENPVANKRYPLSPSMRYLFYTVRRDDRRQEHA